MKTSFALIAAACLSVFAATSHANQDEPPAYPEQQAFDDYVFGQPLKLDLSQIKPAGTAATKQSSRSGVTTRAAAAPLTQVRILAIGSSNIGWENIAAGAQSTTQDHGGAVLLAAVLEMGYGGNAIGRMNGGVLPSSSLYRRDTLCFVNGNATSPCPAGNSVSGFINYWDISGNQNGSFQHTNTSLNSPWNTLSSQVYIR